MSERKWKDIEYYALQRIRCSLCGRYIAQMCIPYDNPANKQKTMDLLQDLVNSGKMSGLMMICGSCGATEIRTQKA